MPESPNHPENTEKLRRTLTELAAEFGMRAIVDSLVDIDNEQRKKRLAPVEHLVGPDGSSNVQFDNATDEL